MRRKEKAREAARLRSVRRWGCPPKRNTCRITFVSQRHNSLCSDHSSLRRDSQMVRFLKNFFKSSRKPVPPENPAPRTTNIDPERDRDPEGGHRSRKISADKADEADSNDHDTRYKP